MPRRAPLADSLLVSFADAAGLLRVDTATVLRLIHSGHLKPHPVLSDRIQRTEVERFATLDYDNEHAKGDTEIGRTVDAPAAQENWGTPPLRLRKV